MMPVQITVIGTAISTPIIPDICQDPFNIGIGVSIGTGGAATWAVEHCFDFSTVMSPTWNGTTAIWFQNSGLGGTTSGTTVTPLNGNYAFPVAAVRLNVSSVSPATTVVTMNLIQATKFL